MRNYKFYVGVILSFCSSLSMLAPAVAGELGQSLQIYTRLHSFVGRPSWLLVIRAVDSGETIPYIYDFSQGNNFWVAFTFGRNYLITASTLQFSPYQHNPFTSQVINNFCHLESQGQIIRGQSMYIKINGDLTPDSKTFTCSVARYTDANFYIVQPGME